MMRRRHLGSNVQQCAPGYLWNPTTQELIPILPEDHPQLPTERRDHRGSDTPLERRDITMTGLQPVFC
jgi:hypothetical protein